MHEAEAEAELPGWSAAQLHHALYELPRQALVELPGMEVIERPGWWQLITPSFRQGGLNEVSLCVLDGSVVDAAIDRALDDYRSRGLRFRWSVFPGSKPDDLGARLAARGMSPRVTLAMARRVVRSGPESGLEAGPGGEGVELRPCGPELIDRCTEIMAEGWGTAPGPLADYNRRALASERHRFFIAREDGGAWSAAAGSALFDRSVHLLGAVVLPPSRGRGLYRALVRARTDDAAARGIDLATTHALADTSAPILRRLGFVERGRFTTFHAG